MYHGGNLSRVKEHIVENMASDEGHLRVLISTIAFEWESIVKKLDK